MDKIKIKAHTMRIIAEVEQELPADWAGPEVWSDVLHEITDVIVDLRGQFDRSRYVALLSTAAMALRQYRAEKAACDEVQQVESGRALSASPYIWIYDAPGEGWNVEVPGSDKPEVQEQWFQARCDAQMFAAGLAAGRGWTVVDDSTMRADEEEKAERATQAVAEFLRGLNKCGGAGNA